MFRRKVEKENFDSSYWREHACLYEPYVLISVQILSSSWTKIMSKAEKNCNFQFNLRDLTSRAKVLNSCRNKVLRQPECVYLNAKTVLRRTQVANECNNFLLIEKQQGSYNLFSRIFPRRKIAWYPHLSCIYSSVKDELYFVGSQRNFVIFYLNTLVQS